MSDESADVVKQASIDEPVESQSANTGKRRASVERPYPRRTLEDALKIANAIREHNGGNPWPPAEIAKSLRVGGTTGSFYYWTAAARDFGLTEGSRDTAHVSLTELGRRAVYPSSEEAATEARREAFNKVDLFKRVAEHYHGSALPQPEFLKNTLQVTFGLDPRAHDEFIDLFKKNAKFAAIDSTTAIVKTAPASPAKSAATNGAAKTTPKGARPVCFVVMPFVERTDEYATGFFKEVFAHLFKPAIEGAGFEPKTAQRQGSDVIHATIVQQLFEADLVLADLTEHNPNVLFELGVRLALEKPTALVRAHGTPPIFDVDNLLRVESYNPNLWPSTVPNDVARLTEHVQAAWDMRERDVPFMTLLRQTAASV